jgi:hypothetical protein
MTRRVFVGAFGVALAGAMCGGSVPAPQGLSIGHSKCAKCGNTLYTLEAAGQAVYQDGTVRYYDDIGCMATDPEALKGEAQLYVQMAGSKGWVRVEDITFAAPRNAQTARGYGYLAYPEEESRQIAPDHWARGWSDLVKELAKKQ